MSPLARLATRSTGWALLAAGSVALAGAAVRLLPWVLDPRVPWRVVVAFGGVLVAAGLEVAGLVALPVGVALAAASLADRGEAQACLFVGASPFRLARGVWPVALAVAATTGAASLVTGGASTAPGRALQGLVGAARDGCDADRRPVSDVPGTAVAWLCRRGEPPMLAAATNETVVTASAATVEDDLASAELRDASFDVRGPPRLHVTASVARVVGLGSLGPPPSRLRRSLRAAATFASCLAAAIAVAASLLRRPEPRRVVALAAGGGASLAAIVALRAAEARGSTPLLALAAPAVAAAVPVVVAAIFRFSSEARIDARDTRC